VAGAASQISSSQRQPGPANSNLADSACFQNQIKKGTNSSIYLSSILQYASAMKG